MLGSFDDLGQIMEEIVSIIMYKGYVLVSIALSSYLLFKDYLKTFI